MQRTNLSEVATLLGCCLLAACVEASSVSLEEDAGSPASSSSQEEGSSPADGDASTTPSEDVPDDDPGTVELVPAPRANQGAAAPPIVDLGPRPIAGPRERGDAIQFAANSVEEIDAYVLARSIDQLSNLELRRGGRLVWSRARADIQAFVPPAGTFHMTVLEFKKRWLDTFWAWSYPQSGSANADAFRIASALSSYFVGVRSVTVGPECRPQSGSYVRGRVSAGAAGDGALAQLGDELARSEAEVKRLASEAPEAACFTGLSADVPAQQVAVVIDLPLDATAPVTADDIWIDEGQGKQRPGVPVPAALYPIASSDELPVSPRADVLARIDDYVLFHSLEQLARLEVRRADGSLFARGDADVTPLLDNASAPLMSLQRTRDLIDVLSGWFGERGTRKDAVRVARALSSYFVGINAVSIGPECGPISGGYMYGLLKPGVPGDDARAALKAEIARSEQAIEQQIGASPTTSCITALRPNPTGNATPASLIIELPMDDDSWVEDTQIKIEGSGARVGLPVPPATTLIRGKSAS